MERFTPPPLMERGYCLWVGAGVSRQVAGADASVPLWDHLTDELEQRAGLVRQSGDYPDRLDRCVAVLGRKQFDLHLRKRYHAQLCLAILKRAHDSVQRGELAPRMCWEMAGLGQLANPVVSFNIEMSSSILLARPAGPARIVSYSRRKHWPYQLREPSSRFSRLVYHPHGVVMDNVMTSTDYETHRGSLAFQLAIHAAFGNVLAIVGMSLDDRYLRRQLVEHRQDIDDVYWFGSSFSDEARIWAEHSRITVVTVDWPSFWDTWSRIAHATKPELDVIPAWYLAVEEARLEAEGGAMGGLKRNHPRASLPDSLAATAEELATLGLEEGEEAIEQRVAGFTPGEIVKMLDDQIPADVLRPKVQRSFAPST